MDFTHNIAEVRKAMSKITKSQVPFATAMALNDTAEDVITAETRELVRSLDRPTPYTQKGFYQQRANKSKLVATVGVKTIQAAYLQHQVYGGDRTPKRRAIIVPVKARRNKYGNLPKGVVARTVAGKKAFVASKSDPATKHLRPGVYKRGVKKGRGKKATISGPELLFAFEERVTYRKRFRFRETAVRTHAQKFRKHFEVRLAKALATAK